MNLFTSQLNARRVLWRKSNKPDELWVCHGNGCLENGQRTPDRRFRLGVNIRTGYAHCFNCGFGSKSKDRTYKALAHWFSIDLSDFVSIKEDIENQEGTTKRFILPEEFIAFGNKVDKEDEFEREAWHYLIDKRKVTVQQMVNKRIGYAITGKYAYRILFPFWDDDRQLLGIVGRAFSDSEPKYLNSTNESGFQRSFYNAHKLPKLHKRKAFKEAVLSEGVFDALAIERCGYLSLATFGSVLTEKQIDILAGIQSIVEFADNDFAGIEAAIKNADALSLPFRKVRIAYSQEQKLKDASELAENGKEKEIVRSIINAQPFSEFTALRLRTEIETMRL